MKKFLFFLVCVCLPVVSAAQNSDSQIIRLKYRLDIGGANDRAVYALFSPDGKKILLICQNSTQIWSAETGKLVLTFPEAIPLKNGREFKWQPNGTKVLQYAALPDKNSAAYLWDTESGKLSGVLSEERGVKQAEWNSLGDRILTVGDFESTADNKRVSLSVRDENGKSMRTDSIRTYSLLSIRFAGDGKNIIASYRVDYRYDDKGKPIRVYDAATGTAVRSYDQELKKTSSFDYAVFSAESPDGKFICGQIYFSKGVTCWRNAGDESPLYYFLDEKATGDISFLSFSRDSRYFTVSKPKRKVIEIIDAETGKMKTALENTNKAKLYFYGSPSNLSPAIGDSWSPSGKFFVATDFEKAANIWDTQTGGLIARLPVIYDDDHDWFVGTLVSNYEAFHFHPSEKILLSVSNEVVRLWKPETGELLQEIKETGKDKAQRNFQRYIAGWNSVGNLLMTAANGNKTILLWEVFP